MCVLLCLWVRGLLALCVLCACECVGFYSYCSNVHVCFDDVSCVVGFVAYVNAATVSPGAAATHVYHAAGNERTYPGNPVTNDKHILV